ncbi:MAG TPA: enoyl-CoA hydratase/isomerase family protein [Streptosporangiaceae bacterium]
MPLPGPAELAQAGLRLELDVPVAGAATVTLSRPERRNAMTPGMWRGLAAVGRSLPTAVRVVVIRGDGPVFCAGIDLRLLAGEAVPGEEPIPSPADPGFEAWIASCQEGFGWLHDASIVSVAAVQGHAIGAGFQLALACDLRVLAEDAQLSMREPTLGLVPDLMGTKPLVDLAGLPRALELCLTGRSVPAAEARALRLAELVVPGNELEAAVSDLASAILAIDPATARAVKQLLGQAAASSLAGQAAAERHTQAALQRGRLA